MKTTILSLGLGIGIGISFGKLFGKNSVSFLRVER